MPLHVPKLKTSYQKLGGTKKPLESKPRHLKTHPTIELARAKRWPVRTVPERFWSHVDKTNLEGCWPWQAFCYASRYGTFNIKKGRWEYAHRFAYELAKGPIPWDKHVCHTCDNPPCCNPAHLWLGTHQENMTDMKNKGRRRRNPQ